MIKGAPRPRFQHPGETITSVRLENEPYVNRELVSIKMLTKSSSFDHWTFSRNRARLLSHFESATARGPLLTAPSQNLVCAAAAVSQNQFITPLRLCEAV